MHGLHQYQQKAEPILPPEPPAPAPDLSWAPSYPDQHLRARPNIMARHEYGINVDPIADAPDPGVALAMRWSPTMPTWIAARPFNEAVLPETQRSNVFPIIQYELGWAPTFQTVVLPRPLPQILRTQRTDPPPSMLPLPAPTTWMGTFPSTTARLVLPVAVRPTLTEPIEPVAAVVVPELAWAPVYPDWLPVRGLRPPQQMYLVGPIDPIAENAFVPLSWTPTYPTLLRPRAPLAPAGGRVAPPDSVAIVDLLRWQGEYPSFLWSRSRTPHLLPPTETGRDLRTIANGHTCLHLSPRGATYATLLSVDVTQPGLLTPAVEQSDPPLEVC